MDNNEQARIFSTVNEGFQSPESLRAVEPIYPILSIDEFGGNLPDITSELQDEDKAQLREYETPIHIHYRSNELPHQPISANAVLMKAANARIPEEIGFMGPTVASVNINETSEPSRYQRQHGRDDLIVANDVAELYPQLLDTVVESLASTAGMIDEVFVPGMPYGFEKPGSIILTKFSEDDPIGQKFVDRKDWKKIYYASADAPGLFVAAILKLQDINPQYLHHKTYMAKDSQTYSIGKALDSSVGWMTNRMDESPNGMLIEYSNPYTNGKGMRNQGWKDSADAMVHTNGDWVNARLGVSAIEIQCQAVISLKQAAHVYRTVYGDEGRAQDLEIRSSRLREFIINEGWIDSPTGGYFAMGWDRDDNNNLRRIETRSIDMHSVLRILDMTNPLERMKAEGTIRTLTSEDMLTRWGVRVMSSKEKAYGHLRYHCGVWLDKTDRVAESMSIAGLHGLDRIIGSLSSAVSSRLGCFPEHISGEDSEYPILPMKDLYTYNRKYNEVHLIEQAPPLGQTWGASSEIGKTHRYLSIPLQAASQTGQIFEKEILNKLTERFGYSR